MCFFLLTVANEDCSRECPLNMASKPRSDCQMSQPSSDAWTWKLASLAVAHQGRREVNGGEGWLLVTQKHHFSCFKRKFFGTVSECTFCNCKDWCFFSLVAAPLLGLKRWQPRKDQHDIPNRYSKQTSWWQYFGPQTLEISPWPKPHSRHSTF